MSVSSELTPELTPEQIHEAVLQRISRRWDTKYDMPWTRLSSNTALIKQFIGRRSDGEYFQVIARISLADWDNPGEQALHEEKAIAQLDTYLYCDCTAAFTCDLHEKDTYLPGGTFPILKGRNGKGTSRCSGTSLLIY